MEQFSKLRIFAVFLILFCAMTVLARANSSDPDSDFSQQELSQMLAPIALYPDALLSQILMASTYPLEVAEAANWSREHRDFVGENAVMAVEQNDWDPSVKSLVAFPQVLLMMNEKLEWTEKLGEAFMAQQAQVMDTVQNLRHKAIEAGTLVSNDKQIVEQQGDTIVITQVDPQMMYVPYYNPMATYGPWEWDAYPPVYWNPWPDYYSSYDPGLYWDNGIFIGSSFFFGGFDWRHRHACIVNFANFHRHHFHDGQRVEALQVRNNVVDSWWHHDPEHRRGIAFHKSWLRQQFQQTNAAPTVVHTDPTTSVTRSLLRNEILGNPMTRPALRGTSQSRISSSITRSIATLRDERRREALVPINLDTRAMPQISTSVPIRARITPPAVPEAFAAPIIRPMRPVENGLSGRDLPGRGWHGLENRQSLGDFRGRAMEAPSSGVRSSPRISSGAGATSLTGGTRGSSQDGSLGGGQGSGHHRGMSR